MTTIETVTVDAFPLFRARIVADADPQPPYDDGGVPILRTYRDRIWGGWHADQLTDVTSYTVPAGILEAARRWGAGETFDRYARIYHGVTRVETYGPNHVTNCTYLALDPADWRETVGASVEAIAAQDDLMGEYRAFLEGDTYGIVVERSETWRKDGTDEEREDWDEVDACWGFYGDPSGYVADCAREMIVESAGA